MSNNHIAITTALAGIYQAVTAVNTIARKGTLDTIAVEPCIYSLFQIDAPDVDAVFGAPGAVIPGTQQLVAQLTGHADSGSEITRYVIQIIRLEANTTHNVQVRNRLRTGIEEAVNKREHFGLLHANLFAHFAELYQATLSNFRPRLLIRGEPLHLRNPDNQNRIRTLLLAGVRAAMLWRQVGGSRWQILFQNKRILNDARHYLDHHAN